MSNSNITTIYGGRNSNKLASLIIALFLFSTACFRNEDSLLLLMISGIVVIVLAVYFVLRQGITIERIINNKVSLWITALYLMYEIYGIFF